MTQCELQLIGKADVDPTYRQAPTSVTTLDRSSTRYQGLLARRKCPFLYRIPISTELATVTQQLNAEFQASPSPEATTHSAATKKPMQRRSLAFQIRLPLTLSSQSIS